jgi:hypothetical protein
MHIEDLESLKLAIDTNNPGLYHGHWEDALSEVVEELLECKERNEELADAKNEYAEARGYVGDSLTEIAELESYITNEREDADPDEVLRLVKSIRDPLNRI